MGSSDAYTNSSHSLQQLHCLVAQLSALLYFIFKCSCLSVLVPATVFLEFWKRRRAVIAYDWDLIDWEEEEVCIIYTGIFKNRITKTYTALSVITSCTVREVRFTQKPFQYLFLQKTLK